MAHHHHIHGHDHVHPSRTLAAGSRLLAMSAAQRLLWAAGLLAILWACVGWAVSYETTTRAPAEAHR